MSLVQCMHCGSDVSDQAAMDGWCESCGKKLPESATARVRKVHTDAHHRELQAKLADPLHQGPIGRKWLGMIDVKSPLTWCILSVIFLAILLSLGWLIWG